MRLLLFVLFVSPFIEAQTIKGFVYDFKTKEPLPYVNVYLDGTSFLTITNTEGYFGLLVRQRVDTRLVISCVGYERVFIEHPYDKEIGTIYLKEKVNEIGEVVISAGRFSRDMMLAAFRQQFLGNTYSGKYSVIENEDDIILYYDSDNKKLTASSKTPLIINNKYLGYELQFDLMRFDIEYYTDNTLSNRNVRKTLFLGSSFFKEKETNRKILKRRQNVYNGSAMHFFKLLAGEELENSKFKIHDGVSSYTSQNAFFRVLESDSIFPKTVIVKPDIMLMGRKNSDKEPTRRRISVVYNDRIKSEITFYCDEFKVSETGLTDNIDNIYFAGYMGSQRAADLLPYDYVPD